MKALDALKIDITSKTKLAQNYFYTLQLLIKNEFRTEANIILWKQVFIILRKQISIYLKNTFHDISLVNYIILNTQVLISDSIAFYYENKRLIMRDCMLLLRMVSHELSATFNLNKIKMFIMKHLSLLGIKDFYLILFGSQTLDNNEFKQYEISYLILVYQEHKEFNLNKNENKLLTKKLFPKYIKPFKKRNTFVICPLHFDKEYFGYIIVNYEPKDPMIFETLREQISTGLKGTVLIKEQQKLDKLKTNFFTNISHELRTPLTLILGPLESILSGDYGKNINNDNDIFKSMIHNGARLLRLVNNLLDFSKIESGKITVNKKKTLIHNLIKFYFSAVESAAKSRKLNIIFNNKTDGINAWVDRDLIEKAVFNLISNAMKFTPEGGNIIIELTKSKENFNIIVKDNGIGIPKDKLDIIFDRFAQVDGSASRQYEGTGIGLSLIKEIIELHEGAISVDSKLDKGSVFTITLPYGKEENKTKTEENIEDFKEVKSYLLSDVPEVEDEIENEGERENKISFTRLKSSSKNISEEMSVARVLFIDDNADMRTFINNLLKDRYKIFLAKNGEEGIEKTKKILPDVMMPQMDGNEFCGIIKSDPDLKHIPVILLSARAHVFHKIEGLEIGADDYITKPFNSEELKARINNLLRNRKLEMQLLKEKMDRDIDLKQASLVQENILTPENTYAKIDGIEIDVKYLPMNQKVSGDYYNISELKNGVASIMIADATGHGVQAAMSTMQIDILNKETLYMKHPDERLEYINDKFSGQFKSKNFFTAFLIHIYNDKIYYCSAAIRHHT